MTTVLTVGEANLTGSGDTSDNNAKKNGKSRDHELRRKKRPTKLGTNAAAVNSSDIVYGSMLEFVFFKTLICQEGAVLNEGILLALVKENMG